jgi:hypothetical protein
MAGSAGYSNIARAAERRDLQRVTQKRYFVDRVGILRNPLEGEVAIRVTDISLSGVRASLPCRLKPPTEVEIEFAGAVLKGIVRHCQCLGAAAFTVGIWLPECDPEKPQTLNPHHLRVLRDGTELDERRRNPLLLR